MSIVDNLHYQAYGRAMLNPQENMPPNLSFQQRCYGLLTELGLIQTGEKINIQPLTGGVSSEIAKVITPQSVYCVKFALAQLKVAQVWEAPTRRSFAEYNWLNHVHTISPTSVPKLFGYSHTYRGFAMEFISGPSTRLWKTDLFDKGISVQDSQRVAKVLGRIHQYSALSRFPASKFQNQTDFWALRLEPYIHSLIEKHPALAAPLHAQINSLKSHDKVMIHGDISPKNILFKDDTPVFLDAECATMGDPVFDVAFCLNHFILKALHSKTLHSPVRRASYIAACLAFWEGYADWINWETSTGLEKRLTALLPILLLARVDGKSPVEYLTAPKRARIRAQIPAIISAPPATLSSLLNIIKDHLSLS